MHGVKRAKLTPQALEARKQKERAKIQEFLALSEEILQRKQDKDYSEEAFKQTTRLLAINPEFYTVWNYRRAILLDGLFTGSSVEQINNLLAKELEMTMIALKSHPKVYWIWNHRRWCLEHVPNGPGEEGAEDSLAWKKSAWDQELYVVERLLDAGCSELWVVLLMAWNYRRYVLASMPVPRPDTAELAYTSKKIQANFSNFSAWHQRSKVLPKLWASGALDEAKSREEEFDLVRNAMYTDPDDQSVWVYHRWLVGSSASRDLLEREIQAIEELLGEQPDSKWCMESIVHYVMMLLKNHSSGARQLLGQLEDLDPYRRHRYRDLGPSSNPNLLWDALTPG
ncbi:rab-protein geranylgeranyltransferase [Ephemerocybe angulata]|uniref:Geranylgeranyl transferase type-2 subunit alpha n=1 Tax=Ephemerocybe angulata TaxID=980116 RepID=A0A8H6IG33_9AGAR|nr:rab-protein geranylgeranyltransferase [Tulosesus angulatus]